MGQERSGSLALMNWITQPGERRVGTRQGCSDQVRHNRHAVKAVGQHNDGAILLLRAHGESLKSPLVVVAPLKKGADICLKAPAESPCDLRVLHAHLRFEPVSSCLPI